MRNLFSTIWKHIVQFAQLIGKGILAICMTIGEFFASIGVRFRHSTSWITKKISLIIRNLLEIIVSLPETIVHTVKLASAGVLKALLLTGHFVNDYLPKVVFSFYDAIYRLSAGIKHFCSGVVRGIVSSLSEWHINKSELKEKVSAKETKQRKRLKQLLNTFHISVPLFENISSEIGYNYAIYICQGISFFTTLGGASYYLSGMAAIIPGLIDAGFMTALLVQGMIIKLSKKRSTKKNPSQWLLLALLTTVSIYFSFIGAANITAPPYEKYSKIYDDQVYSSVSNILTLVKDNGYAGQLTAVGSPERLANLMYGKYADVGLMLSENPPDNNGDNWSTLRSKFASYGNIFSDLDALTSTLSSNKEDQIGQINMKYNDLMVLARNMAKAVNFEKTKYNDDGSPVIEKGTQKMEIVQFHPLATPLVSRLNRYLDVQGLKPLSSAEIIAGETDILRAPKATGVEANGESTVSYEEAGEDTEFLTIAKKAWAWFLDYKDQLGGTEAAVKEYNLVLDNYYSVAQDYYQFFLPLFEDINQENEQVEGDDQTKSENVNMQRIKDTGQGFLNRDNANIVHFKRLFSKEWGNLIVPLIIALFFDGLTFLIALAAENRLPALLRVKSNRDNVDSEAALLEQVFFSMNEGFIKETVSGDQTAEGYSKECEKAVNDTISKIQAYLKVFQLSPETRQQGCAQKATKAVLSNSEYQALTTILLQRGYLVYLSPDEYKKYMLETQDVRLSEEEMKKVTAGEGYYFLRNRAENYLRQSVNGETIFLRITKHSEKNDKKDKEKEGGETL